jgi:hypothetical protein
VFAAKAAGERSVLMSETGFASRDSALAFYAIVNWLFLQL